MEYESLYPHQKNAVQLLRSEWRQNRTHLIYSPTGSGKTAIASYLTGAFAEKGKRVLFIAPYTILIEQTIQRFKQYGLPPVGVIWQNHPDYNPRALIQIASADTLTRREFPDEIDLVIVDECHLRRKKLLEIFADAEFPVIGLSGTPFTKWLGKYYESLIKPCSMKTLIKGGYLSDYELYAPIKPDLSGVKTSNLAAFGEDYNEDQVAEIMGDYKLVGSIVQNWLKNGQDLPTICFCCNVLHAGHVANEFSAAGVEAEVMTAKTPQEERKRIVARFELGATKVICNIGVLTAGFDSDVRCLIYARPTKSEVRWVQSLGRSLRTAPGKDKAIIFDHSGTVHRLGFPDDIEYDQLLSDSDGLSEQERVVKEIEKKEKLPKECPKCKFMKAPGVPRCLKCGFQPRAGDDVETDETRELAALRSKLEDTKKPTEPTKEDKQRWWSELKGYQRELAAKGKNYSDGWVSHKYKERFGVWPRGLHDTPRPASVELKNYIKAGQIRYAKGREKAAKVLEELKEAVK